MKGDVINLEPSMEIRPARKGVVLNRFALDLFRIAYRLGEQRAATKELPAFLKNARDFHLAVSEEVDRYASETIDQLLTKEEYRAER